MTTSGCGGSGCTLSPPSSNLTGLYSPVEVCLPCSYTSNHTAHNNELQTFPTVADSRLQRASWQPGMATHNGIASASYMWACDVLIGGALTFLKAVCVCCFALHCIAAPQGHICRSPFYRLTTVQTFLWIYPSIWTSSAVTRSLLQELHYRKFTIVWVPVRYLNPGPVTRPKEKHFG